MLNQCLQIGEVAGYTLLEQHDCFYLTERKLVLKLYCMFIFKYIHMVQNLKGVPVMTSYQNQTTLI